MERLGYQKYYVLGEDWGSFITADLAVLYPNRVRAIHVECGSFHPWDALKQWMYHLITPVETFYKRQRSIDRFYPYSKIGAVSLVESGYMHIQATKPDTVGVALTQSPSGLAAYILEKFSTWTNESYMSHQDGGLTHKFTMDELLDNVMVYWVSGSITSSMRLYSEMFSRWGTHRVPVRSPTACLNPPEDLLFLNKEGLTAKYPNLQRLEQPNEGGHFAVYEIPHVVAKAALEFFNHIEFKVEESK